MGARRVQEERQGTAEWSISICRGQHRRRQWKVLRISVLGKTGEDQRDWQLQGTCWLRGIRSEGSTGLSPRLPLFTLFFFFVWHKFLGSGPSFIQYITHTSTAKSRELARCRHP